MFNSEEKNKCEEVGFVHAWIDITSHIVYPTHPPQYPNKKRKCLNCGCEEELVITQEEIQEWQCVESLK